MGFADPVLGFKWAGQGVFYQEAVECYGRRVTYVLQRTVVESGIREFFSRFGSEEKGSELFGVVGVVCFH